MIGSISLPAFVTLALFLCIFTAIFPPVPRRPWIGLHLLLMFDRLLKHPAH